MTYEDSIQEAFSTILKLSSKLSGIDRSYLTRQLHKITDHINRQEEQIKRHVERINGMPSKTYDDALEYFVELMQLHGYSHFNVDREKYRLFVRWFNRIALIDDRFRPKYITAAILDSFVQSFSLFELNFEREPKDYNEFREFYLNSIDVIEKSLIAQLEKIEGKNENKSK